MNCTTKSIYKSMEACPGEKVLPGIRRRIYFVPKRYISVWPKLPNVGEEVDDMAALAVLAGQFTLAEGEYFQFLDLKDEASNVTGETVGEEGSKLINNVANAVAAGSKAAIAGFARQAINDDLVFVYQERGGAFRVIGNEMFTTKISFTSDTGTAATDAKTSTFAINCYDECPAPFYEGTLPLSANQQLDCKTGLVEAVTE